MTLVPLLNGLFQTVRQCPGISGTGARRLEMVMWQIYMVYNGISWQNRSPEAASPNLKIANALIHWAYCLLSSSLNAVVAVRVVLPGATVRKGGRTP